MPKRSDRSKKKKFRKTSGEKAKRIFVRGKTGKHHCALCEKVLHGVPHSKKPSEVRKLAKTKRRPSAIFAGVLCNQCRAQIAEEAAKVEAKAKKISEVELRFRIYVNQLKVK